MTKPKEEKPFNRFIAEVEDIEVIGRVLETQSRALRTPPIEETSDGCPEDRLR